MNDTNRFEEKINAIVLNKRIPYIRIFEKTPLHFNQEIDALKHWSDVILEDIIVFDNFTILVFSVE